MLRKALVGMAAALALCAGSTSAPAQGTAITYQGQLKNSGTAVNSATDMQFSLWTLAVGGTQIGSTVTSVAVPVAEGLFTAPIDFGVNPYTSSQNLFLQVAVRNPAGSGSYVPMGSRQLLTPSPFSLATRGINVNSAGDVKVANGNLAIPAGRLIRTDNGVNTNGGRLHIQSGNDGTFDGLYLNPFPGGGRVYIGNGSGAGEVVAYDRVGIGGVPDNTLHVQGTPASIGVGLPGGERAELAVAVSAGQYSSSAQANELVMRSRNGNKIHFQAGTAAAGLTIASNNNVGIGTTTPGSKLSFGSYTGFTVPTIVLWEDGAGNGKTGIGMEGGAMNFWANGTVKAKVRNDGVFEVKTLQINGGSDLVEGFDSQTAELEPGTLMVIDPAHPGQLMPSTSAYDSKVAGIVSGANGVNPGIKMGQDGVMDGKNPIAMTGRVYVKCSNANGNIQPGDLLTTSNIAGHAMKATDFTRGQGAVVGKAMSALDKDTGLVLVLVNLQ